MDLQKAKESNEGVWCKYKDESYKIKYVSPLKQNYILARDGQLDEIRSFKEDDIEKHPEKMLKIAVNDWRTGIAIAGLVDWKGITSEGKKAPCTEENKKTVFEYDSDRMLFVYERCTNQSFFLTGKLGEDGSKNSKASSITK